MGIPYSRQINAAFDQVTPLVASGYEVLQTTKDIAIVLAFIQVYTAGLLTLILLALLGLLMSLNPDLEKERQALVTPTMRWLASWMMEAKELKKTILGLLSLFSAILAFAVWLRMYYVRKVLDEIDAEPEAVDDVEDEENEIKCSETNDGSSSVKSGKSK